MAFLAPPQHELALFETPQASLFDELEPDRSVVLLSQLVEYFSGNVLNSVWDQNSLFGAPVFAMVDAKGEGFSISHGAVDPTVGSIIAGNTERQFDNLACLMESVQRRVEANGTLHVGFGNRTDGDLGNTPDESMFVQESSSLTFKRLITITNVSTTAVNTSVASDTNFFRSIQELKTASAELRINGILEATSTTNLPLAKLYAGMKHLNIGANIGESRIKYMEVLKK
jgi:hypothetical protein